MGKGRNSELITKRDEALIRRYLYWTEVERLRFDDTLKVLSEREFFISEARVLRIIQENHHKLADISVKPMKGPKTPKIKRSGRLAGRTPPD